MFKWLPALLLVCSPVFGQGFVNVVRDTAAAPSISDCDDVTGLVAWWDATAGITEDVGVTTWADQKGSYDFVQTTDANEPTLTATCQNSLDCVQFDNTDYMTQAGAAEFFDFGNNDYTFVVVANAMTDNNNDYFLTQDGTSTNRTWWQQAPSTDVTIGVSGSLKSSATEVGANTTYLGAWRFDQSGETLELFLNACCTPDAQWTSITGNTVEDGTVILGADYGLTAFDDKKIMEVCVFLSDVSDADLGGLFTALNTKWAVY